jgi:CRISPR-associated endonuclease Cas2
MLTLIVYQIKSDRVRNKLRKILLNYGYAIQNSVFEFRLTVEQRQQLIGKVTAVKNDLSPEDSIRIYQVCRSCLAKVVIIGNKPITSDPLFYMV